MWVSVDESVSISNVRRTSAGFGRVLSEDGWKLGLGCSVVDIEWGFKEFFWASIEKLRRVCLQLCNIVLDVFANFLNKTFFDFKS